MIYKKMVAGIQFVAIKVDGNIICDGHHRYMASLLANYSIDTVPSARTSATIVTNWNLVRFDPDDWDTPAKIGMLNEIDAVHNNMPVEKLLELLK